MFRIGNLATGILRHPSGPRVYVANRRIHHGSAGCALALLGLARGHLLLTIAGAALVADDRADFPWRDCDNHDSAPAPA
jgi:hypothetical protein